MTHRTVHVTITGRVQGVGFRAHVRDRARELGVSGWVRNREDGSVEARVSGPAAAVEEMLDALREGPSFARVEKVNVRDVDATVDEGFHVRC